MMPDIRLRCPIRRNKDKSGPDAKELLKKYGSAYLITSISLALVSFSICYVSIHRWRPWLLLSIPCTCPLPPDRASCKQGRR